MREVIVVLGTTQMLGWSTVDSGRMLSKLNAMVGKLDSMQKQSGVRREWPVEGRTTENAINWKILGHYDLSSSVSLSLALQSHI